MVMLLRSLRAVLRKESCMFCAGLLSIADLLVDVETDSLCTCDLALCTALSREGLASIFIILGEVPSRCRAKSPRSGWHCYPERQKRGLPLRCMWVTISTIRF